MGENKPFPPRGISELDPDPARETPKEWTTAPKNVAGPCMC